MLPSRTILEEFYEGDMYEGVRHGVGAYRYRDGSRYFGQWHKGIRHGQGRMEESDGSVYEGEFLKDVRHGKGHFTIVRSGVDYNGDFVLGEMHGQGESHFRDGSSYAGALYRGVRHGRGVETDPVGGRFEGHFENGRRVGHGHFVLPDASPAMRAGGERRKVRVAVFG